MCGRFVLDTPDPVLAQHFRLVAPPGLPPRYNVAPQQLVAVVGRKPDGVSRGLIRVRWGLVPHWAAAADGGFAPINAKAETVDRLPTFREAVRSKRCLIPASGFYEWKADGKRKTPHLFRPAAGGVLAFAGLWDRWPGPPPLLSCCIVTTTANAVVRPFHDRMPVILDPKDYDTWLDAE